MHDLAELFREAASRGFIVMVPPARALAVPSTPADAEAVAITILRRRLDLTPAEARALLALARRGHASKMEVHVAIAGGAPVTGDKVVEVIISRLRAKLKPSGIEITTVWKAGYKLAEAGRDKIRALLGSSGEKAVDAAPPPDPISPTQ
jgi:DNA-binding winged helix-turn-helix (wHTH) protein